MKIFNKLPNTVTPIRVRGGIRLDWSRKGVGFGCLTLVVRRGKLYADTECMGSGFCADVVKQAIEEAVK